jgi:hypothetical protein
MKIQPLLLASFMLALLPAAQAATTIDAGSRYAYGANIGWLNGVADTNNGAVIGEYVCAGYLYAANVGWINLGGGAPANQIQYQNNSATDFGVNQDGLGHLTGYAYGANIGWINFEQTYGKPKVDLATGNLSGSVWSANCGWISLSNTVAFVQTDAIQKGALAPDGLPVAWLLQNFGTTNVNANADADGDGISNAGEYQAGTSPTNSADYLHITGFSRNTNPADPTYNILTWASQPTRFYTVQTSTNLATGVFSDYLVLPYPGLNSVGFNRLPDQEFYRIRAYRPLMP